MKRVGFFLTLGILVNIPNALLGQRGYKVIDRAEAKYQKGKYDKALRLLNKAEKMDYGFCGNAWIEADMAIMDLRVSIYMAKKEYQKVRNSLDSSGLGFTEYSDSIRIVTYQMEYGKDSLAKMIDSSLQNINIRYINDICIADIQLTNGDFIQLKSPWILFSKSTEENKAKWLFAFRKSRNYRLIKNI